MAIEDIIKKIKDDAQKQAESIFADAKQKRKAMVEEASLKGAGLKNKIIVSAKEDAAKQKGRLIATAFMGLKMQVLQEKQAALDEAFKKAQQALLTLDDASYKDLVRKMILKSAQTGDEEIIVSQNEKRIGEDLITDINKELKSKNKKGQLRLVRTDAQNTGGFILKGNKMLINNAFPVLLEELKPSLQKQIAETLFK